MTKFLTLALALSSFVLSGCAAQNPGGGMVQGASQCPAGQVMVEGTCAPAPTR